MSRVQGNQKAIGEFQMTIIGAWIRMIIVEMLRNCWILNVFLR